MGKQAQSKKAKSVAVQKKNDKQAENEKGQQWVNENLGMTDEGELKCLECDKTFLTVKALFNHATRTHFISKASCEMCHTVEHEASQISDEEKGLVKLTKDPKKFLCGLCPADVPPRSFLHCEKHYQKDHHLDKDL